MAYGVPGTYVTGGAAAAGMMAPMQLPKAIVRNGEQALWSTQFYANALALSGSSNNKVFVTPQGQTGQGFAASLSVGETNMKESSRIPSGYAYTVMGIAQQFYYTAVAGVQPICGADLRNALANCVLVWDFLQTQIDIAPCFLIGSGGGIYGSTADTGGVEGGAGGSRIALNNGNGQLWIYQRNPVLLSSDSTFGILQNWGTLAAPVDGGINNQALLARTCLLGQFQAAIAVG
jgi:hypothetical protein